MKNAIRCLTGVGYGILLWVGLCVPTTRAADVYYVSPTGPGGNYKSWSQAASNIQTALDAAKSGDTVQVSNGLYVLSAQIRITNGVSLVGIGGPTETIVDGGYTPGGATTNRCLEVVSGNPFITGFTFSNGAVFYADGGGILMSGGTLSNCVVRNNLAYLLEKGTCRGGGIFADGSTITDCWIINNLVEAAEKNKQGWQGGAGGVYLKSGLMTDCVISNNALRGGYASAMLGAGVSAELATLRSCVITDNNNQLGWAGGAWVSGATLDGCTITRNQAMSYGGGCHAVTGVFTNCLFSFNYATVDGGGLMGRYVAKSRFVSVFDSRFIGNTNGAVFWKTNNDTWFAGAQYLLDHCVFDANTKYGVLMAFTNDLMTSCEVRGTKGVGVQFKNGIIRNSVIAGNTNTTSAGGGLLVEATCTNNATISGCTIAGNLSSSYDGSGVRIEATASPSLTISSSVIAGNGVTGLDDIFDAGGVSADALQYSCVGANPGFTGDGILVANPRFKNLAAGNLRLRDGSPCRDKGLTEDWMIGAQDLDGNLRVQFDSVDMGAYELGAIPGFVLQIR